MVTRDKITAYNNSAGVREELRQTVFIIPRPLGLLPRKPALFAQNTVQD